jgi:hypothetical protein
MFLTEPSTRLLLSSEIWICARVELIGDISALTVIRPVCYTSELKLKIILMYVCVCVYNIYILER